jgi:hypothetical protein
MESSRRASRSIVVAVGALSGPQSRQTLLIADIDGIEPGNSSVAAVVIPTQPMSFVPRIV